MNRSRQTVPEGPGSRFFIGAIRLMKTKRSGPSCAGGAGNACFGSEVRSGLTMTEASRNLARIPGFLRTSRRMPYNVRPNEQP